MIPCPARPISGGNLQLAPEKSGDWRYEPKYNGYRAIFDLNGQIYNRHQTPLDPRVAKEFEWARGRLAEAWPRGLTVPKPYQERGLIDFEGLERRHLLAKGTLVVLDLIPDRQTSVPYSFRRAMLEAYPEAPLDPRQWQPKSLYRAPSFRDGLELWKKLRELNVGDFYEGVVAKRADSNYPIQYSEKEFAGWVKHRWN